MPLAPTIVTKRRGQLSRQPENVIAMLDHSEQGVSKGLGRLTCGKLATAAEDKSVIARPRDRGDEAVTPPSQDPAVLSVA
jgi:hypothetical protein